LNGTSFRIAQGETVAFVGSSGCGKSTILRLLYRFYDTNSGEIFIGGQSTRDLTKQSLQKAIAVVPQDIVLFNETIGYNIGYGNLQATMEDVINVAKQARIHDTIMGFEKGYDTIVGERGLKLSGGEKQRVCCCFVIMMILCDHGMLFVLPDLSLIERIKTTLFACFFFFRSVLPGLF
jgi:ATP-binding cassette, subfamily B (MDR/TAP), member 7